MSEVFTCEICAGINPTIVRNIHHKIPEALGGKDTPENRSQLCSGCHDLLHAVAYKLMKPTTAYRVHDELRIVYRDKPNTVIQRCMEFAQLVRDEMVIARERGLNPNQICTANTTLRKEIKELMAIRARDLGVSQDEYLRTLVLQDLSRSSYLSNSAILAENAKIKALQKGRRQFKS